MIARLSFHELHGNVVFQLTFVVSAIFAVVHATVPSVEDCQHREFELIIGGTEVVVHEYDLATCSFASPDDDGACVPNAPYSMERQLLQISGESHAVAYFKTDLGTAGKEYSVRIPSELVTGPSQLGVCGTTGDGVSDHFQAEGCYTQHCLNHDVCGQVLRTLFAEGLLKIPEPGRIQLTASEAGHLPGEEVHSRLVVGAPVFLYLSATNASHITSNSTLLAAYVEAFYCNDEFREAIDDFIFCVGSSSGSSIDETVKGEVEMLMQNEYTRDLAVDILTGLSEGTMCSDSKQCSDPAGCIQGTCGIQPLGGTCASSEDCGPLPCILSSCGHQRDGERCSQDSDCESEWCSPDEPEAQGKCLKSRYLAIGAACEHSKQCNSEHGCVEDKCGRKPDGAACTAHAECDSNDCDGSKCICSFEVKKIQYVSQDKITVKEYDESTCSKVRQDLGVKPADFILQYGETHEMAFFNTPWKKVYSVNAPRDMMEGPVQVGICGTDGKMSDFFQEQRWYKQHCHDHDMCGQILARWYGKLLEDCIGQFVSERTTDWVKSFQSTATDVFALVLMGLITEEELYQFGNETIYEGTLSCGRVLPGPDPAYISPDKRSEFEVDNLIFTLIMKYKIGRRRFLDGESHSKAAIALSLFAEGEAPQRVKKEAIPGLFGDWVETFICHDEFNAAIDDFGWCIGAMALPEFLQGLVGPAIEFFMETILPLAKDAMRIMRDSVIPAVRDVVLDLIVNLENGFPCAIDQQCQSADGCVMLTCGKQDLGFPCSGDDVCNSGVCYLGICAHPLPNGVPCYADYQCETNNCCAGLCASKNDDGVACAADCACKGDCIWFTCGKQDNGLPCTDNDHCHSGICFLGFCGAPFDNGVPCTGNFQCKSSNCCAGLCASRNGDGTICAASCACASSAGCIAFTCGKKHNGNLCTSNNHCYSNFCYLGFCASRFGNGAPCTSSSHCASNNCCGGFCAGRNGRGTPCAYDCACQHGCDTSFIGRCCWTICAPWPWDDECWSECADCPRVPSFTCN